MRYSDLITTQLNEFQKLTNQRPVDKEVLDKLIEFGTHTNAAKIYLTTLTPPWTWIGNGTFGYVAQPPNKQYVIKFWNKDAGYTTAIKLFLNNQNQIHFPKVFMNHNFDAASTSGFAVLENLQPIPHDQKGIIYLINYVTFNHGGRDYNPSEFKIKFAKYLSEKMDLDYDKKFIAHAIQQTEPYFEQVPSLRDAIEKIRTAPRPKNTWFDLHGGNFMMRNNIIVITDPYAAQKNH